LIQEKFRFTFVN